MFEGGAEDLAGGGDVGGGPGAFGEGFGWGGGVSGGGAGPHRSAHSGKACRWGWLVQWTPRVRGSQSSSGRATTRRAVSPAPVCGPRPPRV